MDTPATSTSDPFTRRDWLDARLAAHPGRLRRDGRSTAVEAYTAIGALWLHGDDQLMTPVIREHGVWEPELENLLRRQLRPGMSFVDIGANIGYFSVMAAGLVGPSGGVVSVEPEAGNLALLTANLWRNGHRNAQIAPVAVYSHTGELTFAVPDISRAAGHVVGEGEEGVTIPCISLDDLLGDRRMDMLKIDAEGADLQVLRGGRRVLEANPGAIVVVEVWTEYTPERQFQEFMDEGFTLHLISPDGDLTPAGLDEALSAGSTVTYMNIALRRA